MFSTIIINKDGIFRRTWDKNLREQYDIQTHNGKVVIVRERDNQIVHIVDTEEETDNFFEHLEEIESLLPFLLDAVEIDVTLNELIDILGEYAPDLMNFMFPEWSKKQIVHDNNDQFIFLEREIKIPDEENQRVIENFVSFPQKLVTENSPERDLPIRLSPSTKIHINDTICSLDWQWRVIDVLRAIFCIEHYGPVKITKNNFETTQKRNLLEQFDFGKYLFSVCHAEDDITLHDLFSLIKSECSLSQIYGEGSGMLGWIESLIGCQNLNEFYDEAGKNVDDDKETDITYLEVGWAVVIDLKHNTQDFYPHFYGVGPIEMDKEEYVKKYGFEPPEFETYALEMTPLHKIAHLPLKINTEFEMLFIDDNNNKGQRKKYTHPITFIDVLYAIHDEITFFGSINNRDYQWEDIKRVVDELHLSEIETISWEDAKTELLERRKLVEYDPSKTNLK